MAVPRLGDVQTGERARGGGNAITAQETDACRLTCTDRLNCTDGIITVGGKANFLCVGPMSILCHHNPFADDPFVTAFLRLLIVSLR